MSQDLVNARLLSAILVGISLAVLLMVPGKTRATF
jgi:hypothetical protein